jgi:general secretion pathway protein J
MMIPKTPSQQALRQRSAGGFTLLEVIITLTILVGLVMAVSQLLRSSFDIRLGISAIGRTTQSLNTAMQRLSDDISAAYIISSKELVRPGGGKRTIFKITREGDSDILTMTYMGHQSIQKNAKESEFSYVVYQLKASEKQPGRRHLYRGEFPRVPENAANIRELPPMVLIASNIALLQFDPWLGDDWGRDGWDSSKGDKESKLPAMVRITLRAWEESAEAGPPAEGSSPEEEEQPTVHLSTVAYIPFSVEFPSPKTRMSSFRL